MLKKEIRIDIEEIPAGRVAVSVTNDGDPIPETDINKIWNKFYTTSNNSQRGLGIFTQF